MTRACLALLAAILPGIAGADGAADTRAAERLESAVARPWLVSAPSFVRP
jgi:hypothetical protein